MKTIELSEASKPLSEYADAVDEEIIVLTSKKKPIAALVSLKHVDRESLALSTSPEFMAIIEAAREEFRAGKKLSLEAMKREVLE
jgi:antitoxin (DNA-binding transcriptional repressor) of toxin-antitoxin stability system